MCFGLIPHDHHAYREKKATRDLPLSGPSEWFPLLVPRSRSSTRNDYSLISLPTPDQRWKGIIFSSFALNRVLLFPYSAGPERLSFVQHFPLESFTTWSISISKAPRLPMALIS